MDPRKPKDLPFYETPDHVQTSAKIISEAKTQLVRTQLRSLSTKRPVTPQEGGRRLFGETSVRDLSNRPSSAVSLGSRNFDCESRPVSGTRLTPLDHKTPRQSIQDESPIAPRPPADPNRPISRRGSRSRLQHSTSVDNSQPDLARSRSGSLQDVSDGVEQHQPKIMSGSMPNTPESSRRVRSGPKERTKEVVDERGIGDGRADQPKAESSRRSAEGKKRSSESRRSGEERHRKSAEGQRSSESRKASAEGQKSRSERVESGYASETRESSAGSIGSYRSSSAGKSGSAGRREEESPEEAYYYNTRVAPIVEEIASHSKDQEGEKLGGLIDKLYSALEEGKMLGKSCKRRSQILKTVFKLLDRESPRLVLQLCRLILALRVSGNNLTNVCKLVFKVSREEKHDSYFGKGNLIDVMLETICTSDHILAGEALVYLVGAIKFLTLNTTLLKLLHKKGCLQSLAKLLANINKTNIETGKTSETFGHILVQLTVCLRNLADILGSRSQFLQEDLVTQICIIIEHSPSDADLMLNVSRILSKLTMHSDCCSVVASHASHFKSFVHMLKVFQRREDLILRLSYVLGNLMAKSDLSRTRFYQQPKGFDVLLHVFKYYIDLDKENSSSDKSLEDEKAANKVEDILIKIVRVIANLSINEQIGTAIASNTTCISLLIHVLEAKELSNNEELVLNTIATINNLSFYKTKHSAVVEKQLPLAESLLKFMQGENMDGLAEAPRVFGNLSRDKSIRDFLVDNKVDEIIVVLLDSGKTEVVFTAVGVLINLMADEEKRPLLKKAGGIRRLVEVLRDFSRTDWQLGSMVCQTLWNYSGKITSANSCFGESEAADLNELLIEYLDEEIALDSDFNPDLDEDMLDFVHETWQTEFCPVANQLLTRIEAHQSKFEALREPT